jgi:hypothetical protein
MSYDNPSKRETYVFPSSAFGATTESRKILGPKGKKGTVRDIRTYITADMVGTTTVPEINVGASAGSSEYARHRLGTTAILGNTAAGTPYRARALCAAAQNNPGSAAPSLTDFAGHVLLEIAKIPADTVVFITRTAGVGGTPAGTGITEVDIDWD